MRLGFTVQTVALVSAVAASALLMACGGDGGASKESTSSGTKATTPAASSGSTGSSSSASGGAGSAVNVELADFTLKASSTTAKAGKVEFTVKNSGTTPHELVVVKTDVDAGALQKDASGKVDEAKYAPTGRTKQIAPAASDKVEATLAAGKYVLLCNVPGHYDLGMRAAFTVN